MPIQFACPECQRMLSITRRKIGCQVTCPRCAASITVPSDKQMASLEQAAPRTLKRELPVDLDFPDVDSGLDFIPETPSSQASWTKHTAAVAGAPLSGSNRQRVDQRVSIARSTLYLQAVLMLLFAAIAFGLGYWLGGIDARGTQEKPLAATAEPNRS